MEPVNNPDYLPTVDERFKHIVTQITTLWHDTFRLDSPATLLLEEAVASVDDARTLVQHPNLTRMRVFRGDDGKFHKLLMLPDPVRGKCGVATPEHFTVHSRVPTCPACIEAIHTDAEVDRLHREERPE